MLEYVSGSASVAPMSVQSRVYFPHEYTSGRWMVLYCHSIAQVGSGEKEIETLGMSLHCGRRTGEPVEFSRLSDAERLCDVLNAGSCVD